MADKTDASGEVYLLPLTDLGAPDVPGRYIQLPPPTSPPYSLRFSIDGTSSICREGALWVNIPEAGKPFVRGDYRSFKSVYLFESDKKLTET